MVLPREPLAPKNGSSMMVMISYCPFFVVVLPFFSPLVVQASSKWFLILSWGLFWSILSSQDDPRNLKNLDFSLDVRWILKNQGFWKDDGLESVLGLSWAPFGRSWGSLGSPFGPPDRPQKAATLWPLRSLGSLGSLVGLFFSILAAEDCLKSVLELPWAPFWWSRGLLGALLLPADPILSSKRSTK